METKLNLYPNSTYYVYTKRSCENCELLAKCQKKWKRDNRMRWLDCGRVGCRKYHSDNPELMLEKKIKKKSKKQLEKIKRTDDNSDTDSYTDANSIDDSSTKR